MKKEVKNKKSFFRRLIIAATIISFLSVSFYTVYTIAQSALNKEVTHGQLRDENVILYFGDSQINKGFGLSDGNIVLTTNSLVSFKSDGSVRSSDKLGYSNPLVKSKSGNYIVFERSTGKFAIMNRMGVVYHSDGGEEIINADIAKNGNYAIITRKTQASSVLSVYSSSNKLLFQWECTDEYLSQAALSKNGKTVAVSSIGVKNGEAYSKIMFFNLDSTDVEGAFEYTGESAYVIRFIGNKELSIITDKSYMIADLRSMESQVISYDYDVVDGYAFADNNSAAILKKAFGTLDKYILTVIDKNGEKKFEKEFDKDIVDFKIDDKNVYVMMTGEIVVYSISSGEKLNITETDGGLNSMFVNDGYVYCLSDTDVYKYDF